MNALFDGPWIPATIAGATILLLWVHRDNVGGRALPVVPCLIWLICLVVIETGVFYHFQQRKQEVPALRSSGGGNVAFTNYPSGICGPTRTTTMYIPPTVALVMEKQPWSTEMATKATLLGLLGMRDLLAGCTGEDPATGRRLETGSRRFNVGAFIKGLLVLGLWLAALAVWLLPAHEPAMERAAESPQASAPQAVEEGARSEDGGVACPRCARSYRPPKGATKIRCVRCNLVVILPPA